MSDTGEVGPIYGVKLIDALPLMGGMWQAMPCRDDLDKVSRVCMRAAAGYETLLEHYRMAMTFIPNPEDMSGYDDPSAPDWAKKQIELAAFLRAAESRSERQVPREDGRSVAAAKDA